MVNYLSGNGEELSMLYPAFAAGWEDSLNPFTLASVLIFIIFFSFAGYTKKRLVYLGGLYIGIAVLIQWTLCAGCWDALFALPAVLIIIKGVYSIFALLFLVLGSLHFRDWVQYKKYFKTEYFRLALPAFLCDGDTHYTANKYKKFFKISALIMLALFLSGLMTLMGSISPQSDYIFIVHSYRMAEGSRNFVLSAFMLYSIAMTLPLIISWGGVLLAMLSKTNRVGSLIYFKGIFSVLCFATAVGLSLFLFREYSFLN